ncbi:protein-tyrosine-phosphatase [Umbelopsis sp. WA50703]
MPTLPPLIPPFRFAAVEDNVFRGAYPKRRNLRFIKRLHLKTMLSLTPDPLPDDILQYCDEQGIKAIHLRVDKMKEDNIPLTYSRTIVAIQTIIDPQNQPIYVHCLDGSDVTGLIIACLRKLQMWSTSSAMGEYLRFLRSNVISPEVFEFVERFFNLDVTIPTAIPPWLWGGTVSFRKHPSLKLKFLNPEMMTEEEREIKDLKEKKEKDKEEYYRKRKNDLLDNLLDQSGPSGSGRNRQQSQHGGSSLTSAAQSSSTTCDDNDADENGDVDQENKANTQDQNAKDELLVDVDVDAMMIGDLNELNYYDQRRDEDLDKEDIPEDGTGLSTDGRYQKEPLSLLLRALALEGLEW